MTRFALILIVSFWLATTALAHPGHGVPGQGSTLAHALGEPVHVLSAVAVIVVALAAAGARLRSRVVGRRRQ